MNISSRPEGDALILRVDEARVDAAVAIQFKGAVMEATKQAGSRVILDMSQVEFLDSSGLGAVVAVMKLLAPATQLELAGLTPIVAKVFRLTRMDQVFAIHATAEEALAA
jgi:anti-sigma B factor antagonist